MIGFHQKTTIRVRCGKIAFSIRKQTYAEAEAQAPRRFHLNRVVYVSFRCCVQTKIAMLQQAQHSTGLRREMRRGFNGCVAKLWILSVLNHKMLSIFPIVNACASPTSSSLSLMHSQSLKIPFSFRVLSYLQLNVKFHQRFINWFCRIAQRDIISGRRSFKRNFQI